MDTDEHRLMVSNRKKAGRWPGVGRDALLRVRRN